MRKNATITDVAGLAGVSKSTVSAVLNNKDTIKESTRRTVLRAMDELSYRPSSSARRGFRSTTARSIGFVIKEARNPYYAEALAGIEEVAKEAGYLVSVTSSGGDYEVEHRIVELGMEQEVAGMIITPILDYDSDLSHIFELKRHNIPFVLLEDVRGIRASLVDADNVKASAEAVSYLIRNGHSRIVHFSGPRYSKHSEERADGMRRAFSESHLVYDENVIVHAGDSPEDGYRAGLEFFGARRADRVTGVTCYNDLVALGLLRALRELGVGVPEEVSVIGFDDLDILEFFPTRLTTVHVPKYEMGRMAAEILIRQIESRQELPLEKVFLDAKLVVGDTTRALTAERKTTPTSRGRRRGAAHSRNLTSETK